MLVNRMILWVIGIIGLCEVICSIIVEKRPSQHFLDCLYLVIEIFSRIVLVWDTGTWNLWNIIIIISITIEIVLVLQVINIKVIEGDDRAQWTTITVEIIGQILCLRMSSDGEVENMESVWKCLCRDLLLLIVNL